MKPRMFAEVSEELDTPASQEATVSRRWQPHGLFSLRSGLSRDVHDETGPPGHENHPVTPLFTEVGQLLLRRSHPIPLVETLQFFLHHMHEPTASHVEMQGI